MPGRARSLTAALAAALLACACQQPAQSPGVGTVSHAAPVPVLEGQLVLLARPGYVRKGSATAGWVSEFQRATACKVTIRTASTSEEMVALMNLGGIDVVTVSGDASLRLVAAGRVRPIDVSRIPAYPSIDARLRDAAWNTVDGVHYGVPFQWGPNVLMYDARVFKDPPTWSVLFEEQELPDGKSNRGRVQSFDSPITIADAAVYLMKARPELGIADPYRLDESQYAAAIGALRRQRILVQRYWRDPQVQVGDFRSEGVVVASSWPAQAIALQAAGNEVAWTVPAEGATGWADSMMMPSAAAHPNCAYRLMDWALDRRVQGDVAAAFGSVPVVSAACRDNAHLGPDGCQRNGQDTIASLYFWRTPGLGCGKTRCVPYSRWTEDFLKLVDE